MLELRRKKSSNQRAGSYTKVKSTVLIALLALLSFEAQGQTLKEVQFWMKILPNESVPGEPCDSIGGEAHDQEWLRMRIWLFNPAWSPDTVTQSINIDGAELLDSIGVGVMIPRGAMGEAQFWIADTSGNETCVSSNVFVVEGE